jgi:hypothetical protein
MLKGKILFVNGDEYTGELNKKYPIAEGEGVLKYANGAIFQGNFYNGLKHIEGKLTEPDGSFYDGFWENDQRHGLGI